MSTASANTRAALLVVVAMAAFCLNDAVIKTLSTQVPIGELMAVRGLFAIVLMLALLPWLGLRIGRPERFTWFRAAGEAAVTLAFFGRTDPAAARRDLYPLLRGADPLTAGAAIVFGERVGLRRWAAVVTGFVGVLVVLGLLRAGRRRPRWHWVRRS